MVDRGKQGEKRRSGGVREVVENARVVCVGPQDRTKKLFDVGPGQLRLTCVGRTDDHVSGDEEAQSVCRGKEKRAEGANQGSAPAKRTDDGKQESCSAKARKHSRPASKVGGQRVRVCALDQKFAIGLGCHPSPPNQSRRN